MKKSPNKLDRQTKTCPTCKRDFQNRAKWESRGIWDQVKYCSKGCKRK